MGEVGRYERQTPIYRAWREAVLARDEYTCQEQDCGSQKNLNAHHIRRFKNNPEARYDITNGITLCKKCHKRRHKETGTHSEVKENERIPNTIQYNEPKRYYEDQPRTIWKDYNSTKKK